MHEWFLTQITIHLNHIQENLQVDKQCGYCITQAVSVLNACINSE